MAYPRRTPHTFANAGAVPARVFGVTVPGGIEEFFAARSAYLASVQGTPDGAELARPAAGWGRTLGPPISAPAEPQSPAICRKTLPRSGAARIVGTPRRSEPETQRRPCSPQPRSPAACSPHRSS